MGLSTNSSSSRQPMSEINVTPFVDVMLVLLIIFMVTAPMMQQGVDVNLPQTSSTGAITMDEKDVVVTIDAQKNIFVGEKKINQDQLKDVLDAVFDSKENRVAYLRSDQKVDYGFVVEVMGALKNAGVEHVGLATEDPS